MAMVCYLQAAYTTKDNPNSLEYTLKLDYYDCFARISTMWDGNHLPPFSKMETFYLGTAIPLHMQDCYPHKEIREFIRYYRRTHAGRYLAAIKKMDDRVVAFAPNMCDVGVAAALLSPVRMYTEHTSNMRLFIKLCRTGINPNAALLIAHNLSIMDTNDPWGKVHKKFIGGHDAMALGQRNEQDLKKIRGKRQIVPSNTGPLKGRHMQGIPEIHYGREEFGFSAFWWNGKPSGHMRNCLDIKFEEIINQNKKGNNPVRPVGEKCVTKMVRYVMNGTGYSIPNCWKEE